MISVSPSSRAAARACSEVIGVLFERRHFFCRSELPMPCDWTVIALDAAVCITSTARTQVGPTPKGPGAPGVAITGMQGTAETEGGPRSGIRCCSAHAISCWLSSARPSLAIQLDDIIGLAMCRGHEHSGLERINGSLLCKKFYNFREKSGRPSLAVTDQEAVARLFCSRSHSGAGVRAVRDGVRGGGARGGGARARHAIHLEYGSRSSHG